MSNIRKKAITGLEIGDTFSVSRTFTEQDVIRFADISRDYNPVHFDERFAKEKNFDGRICHGLLIASQVTEIGGQIGWLASGMTFKFKKPVYFEDTIKCDLTITDIDERGHAQADAVFTNQYDITVLEAIVTGVVPGTQEKQVMKDMPVEGARDQESGMVKFLFSDIESAFMYVGSAMYGMNSALLCKDTGKILYRSDMAGIDEIEDEEDLDWEQCIEIPHKNDLDLGRNLVFEFVEEYLPDDYDRVRQMFRRSGAYSRYKDLLERRGLLKEWYNIENSREEQALRKWCKENGVELDG